jgi:hypothetical protein
MFEGWDEMSEFLKKDVFRKEVGFWEFTIFLCIGGLLIATSIGYIVDNFILSKSPRAELTTQTIKNNYVSSLDKVKLIGSAGITSDSDDNPKPWWINDERTFFEVKNEGGKAFEFSLSFLLRKNPCGFSAEAKISDGETIIQLVEGSWIKVVHQVDPGKSIILPLTLEGLSCSIPSDPRIFLGSVSTTLNFRQIDEFNFGGS